MTHRWQDDAECIDHPNLFRVDAHAGPAVDVAKAICARCTARSECLEAAMESEGAIGPSGRYGIHGGLTGHERHQLHKQQVKQRRQAVSA
jgi:WhiB family transcriptional regulator, redox-sensing transcriptional regulator